MKKIILVVCMLMLLLVQAVSADNTSELDTIKLMLENKTIGNYETIITPLKGDPEGFNVLPDDDLTAVEFCNGVQGYNVDFEKLEEAYKNGEDKVFPYLIKDNKYYFPVIVSGREVAVVEIIKTGDTYKVLCVTSGSVSDNFIELKKHMNIDNAKYVVQNPIINGFVVSIGEAETFIDADAPMQVDSEARIVSNDRMSVAQEFLNRYSGDEDIYYELGGNSGKNTSVTAPIVCVVIVVLLAVVLYIVLRKKCFR